MNLLFTSSVLLGVKRSHNLIQFVKRTILAVVLLLFPLFSADVAAKTIFFNIEPPKTVGIVCLFAIKSLNKFHRVFSYFQYWWKYYGQVLCHHGIQDTMSVSL